MSNKIRCTVLKECILWCQIFLKHSVYVKKFSRNTLTCTVKVCVRTNFLTYLVWKLWMPDELLQVYYVMFSYILIIDKKLKKSLSDILSHCTSLRKPRLMTYQSISTSYITNEIPKTSLIEPLLIFYRRKNRADVIFIKYPILNMKSNKSLNQKIFRKNCVLWISLLNSTNVKLYSFAFRHFE